MPAHVGVVVGQQNPWAGAGLGGGLRVSVARNPAHGLVREGLGAHRGGGSAGFRLDPAGGKMGAAERKRDGKDAALGHTAAHFNRAAMQFHQILDERQTDSGAFVGSSPGAFDAMKALEDMRYFLFRYADAGVRDREYRVIALGLNTHRHTAYKGELEGIG